MTVFLTEAQAARLGHGKARRVCRRPGVALAERGECPAMRQDWQALCVVEQEGPGFVLYRCTDLRKEENNGTT